MVFYIYTSSLLFIYNVSLVMVLVLVLAELGSDKDTLPGLHCVYADKKSTLAELLQTVLSIGCVHSVSGDVCCDFK